MCTLAVLLCVFFSKANSKILSPLFAAYDAQLDEQTKTMELYRVNCQLYSAVYEYS